MLTIKRWHVWEETPDGVGVSYWYDTRRAQRAHVARVQNNIFLKGWMVRASDLGERA